MQQQQQQQLSLSSSSAHKSKEQQVQQKTHRICEFSTLQRTSGRCPGGSGVKGNNMEITIFFNPLSFGLSLRPQESSLFFFFFFLFSGESSRHFAKTIFKRNILSQILLFVKKKIYQ